MFCFRGLAAKEEKVYLYTVAIDNGVHSDDALTMYNKMNEQAPDPNSRSPITTGFYVVSSLHHLDCVRTLLTYKLKLIAG